VSQLVSWIVSELITIQQHEYNGTVLMGMEGWQEEVEILAQESHCAIQGFNKMETFWTALAHDHQEDPGKKAYALKKANMYQEMGKDAQEKFAKVGGTWPRAGVGLSQHIKSERPDQKIDWDASIAEEN
jgi:hypothetical protein